MSRAALRPIFLSHAVCMATLRGSETWILAGGLGLLGGATALVSSLGGVAGSSVRGGNLLTELIWLSMLCASGLVLRRVGRIPGLVRALGASEWMLAGTLAALYLHGLCVSIGFLLGFVLGTPVGPLEFGPSALWCASLTGLVAALRLPSAPALLAFALLALVLPALLGITPSLETPRPGIVDHSLRPGRILPMLIPHLLVASRLWLARARP